jgi:DNA segregation ATPase FtsK/SpoIIIE, S-DNA-T family
MSVSRQQTRAAVVRFGWTTVLLLATLFTWIALLSFDPADPPASVVYRADAPAYPQNLCGPIGAYVAYGAVYYLGVGSYPLLLLLTAGVVAYCRQARIADAGLRFIGVSFIVTAVSTAATLFFPASDRYLMPGPGGILGQATAMLLMPRLDLAGTTIVLISALMIGGLLTADEWVMRLLRASAGQSVAGAAWLQRQTAAAVRAAVALPAALIGGRNAQDAKPARAKAAAVAAQKASAKEQADEEWEAVAEGEPEDDEYEYVYEEEETPADEAEDEQDEPQFDDEDEAGEEEEYEYEEGEEEEEDEPLADAPAALEADRLSGAGARQLDFKALIGKREPEPVDYHRPPDDDGYLVPTLEELDEPVALDNSTIETTCREQAAILEQTLNEFGREVQVVAIETGPVITVFELRLAAGIKVSQIASLTNDMARALGAPAVRVVAPLPGKNTIGIEVPNLDKEKVRLKDVIHGIAPKLSRFQLPLFLGKDAAGQPLVADLAKMPHLLIAGTTGSGKSVCVSSIVMSILMTRTPSEVQMVLVDPKVVELTMFKDVPHLMCPIVSDMGKAESILEWATTKMDERYALLAEAGVKDIRGYNKLGEEGLRERFQPVDEDEFQRIPLKLPYLVIMIDELADLMMTSAKEVEFYLVRIAQKSRAVGIHLIVSTQRPSANVVTGLIKSNLPSRIAFRVASKLDSRIVLDQAGGEVLMGQGDMLFLPPGQSKLVRAQGTFIDDDELRRVVKHCASQCEQRFHPELTRAPKSGVGDDGERDELFDQAVDLVVASGRGSVSLLQRKLTIGYGRASRLVEQMYEAGLVGEYKGSQAREVTLTREEWEAIKKQRDREEAAETADSQTPS